MAEKGLTLFDLEPKKVLLERFEIVRPLRQTGMAMTFEVSERGAEGARELLVFPSALFESPGQALDFADALRRWRAVAAAAVVRVREVLPHPGGALLVLTDMPPARSLREWLNERGRMGAKDARQLGIALCEGLAAIHEAGLVHGDLKPYTIHVEGDGKPTKPMLVDGGTTPGLWTAKHLGDRTVLIGTPVYAPVEQFGGESPDEASDLYNLATVLYELVAGKVPWAGRNFLEVFQAKLQAPRPMREIAPEANVPAAFEEVVLRGLQADARERYATAGELQAALTKLRV